jgi:hypothetical protein
MQNSYQWVDSIITKLFEAEDNYFDRLIVDLNRMNCEVKKKSFRGFMHMGVRYIPRSERWSVRTGRVPTPLPSLDFSLLDQSDKLTVHFNRVNLDKSQIRQILFELLCHCNTLQEIRDSLPECLVPLVPDVQSLPRFIQNQFYLVQGNKYFMRQYEKVLPKIEYYSTVHLIY